MCGLATQRVFVSPAAALGRTSSGVSPRALWSLTKRRAQAADTTAEIKITPRSEDWSAWYLDVISASDLVDDAPVRGCKVLRPGGFAIWEGIQRLLDPKIKSLGVQNAYFPLLIPVSFLSKEAAHVDGFAKECAVVTHHRLRASGPDSEAAKAGQLVEVDPESKLGEPLVVRPTSETVVWHMYGRWIRSYRDLPMKMNQWVNVVRWEMRTRPFLRSAEFLWQEGHTAHATKEEAEAQARQVLDEYVNLAAGQLALPLVPGRKSERERFAGADDTFTIEALTQNGMAIQAGTSHFLGQNFAKAFDVKYESDSGNMEYVWATSWGVSTRLIGAVIMVHSDDVGLVLPPAVAAIQVVVLPLFAKDPEKQAAVLDKAATVKKQLEAAGIRVQLDERINVKPGAKFFEWERKGVPLRIELGPKDLDQGVALAKMRTGGDKITIKLDSDVVPQVTSALDGVYKALVARSEELKQRLTFHPKSRADFEARLKEREPGMMVVPWGGNSEDEERIQDETGATLRCYPLEQGPIPEGQVCPLTGKPSWVWAVFALAY